MKRINFAEHNGIWMDYWKTFREVLSPLDDTLRTDVERTLIYETRRLARRAFNSGYIRGINERDNGELAALKRNIRRILKDG